MATDADFPSDLRTLEREYELIRELGHGGMAAVYLARRRVSGRLVAIKAIRGRYVDDPDAIQRFAREARTVAGLDHPNIVHTEAIEQIDDRAVAIILEHIPGGTVRDRLREYGALGAEDAEAILRDVASALVYAHRRGIVHRDVKLENVFLDVTRGRAVLSDFGIARNIDGDGSITLLGAALGTPQYMSPEQIDGEKVDGRSDIYSLGVLGWELLTGRRPWAGESLYGVIYKQKHEDLPRITSLRPRVPANLLFAIEGALVKDRERRWQTIDAFLDQLTYNPPPVLAEPYPPGARADDEPTVQFRPIAVEPDASIDVARAHADAATEAQHGDVVAPLEVAHRDEPATLLPVYSKPSLHPASAAELGENEAALAVGPAFGSNEALAGEAVPNAELPFQFPLPRKRVLQALGLIVPMTIAAASLFILLGGGGRDGAGDQDGRESTALTSSAGSIAVDSSAPASTTNPGSSVLAAPVRLQEADRKAGIVAGSSVSTPVPSNVEIVPRPQNPTVGRGERRSNSRTTQIPARPRSTVRVDSGRAIAAARPAPLGIDSSDGRPVDSTRPPAADPRPANDTPIEDPFKIPSAPPKSPESAATGAGPIPRCRIAATADQRACLAAYIEIGDAPLNRTFESLVGEMRRVAGTPLGAPDPQPVQRIRVEQRAWLSVRDAECPRQAPPGGGPFWAQVQSECFAEMAAARTEELRAAVGRLRRTAAR